MLTVPDSLSRCAAEVEGWLELGRAERALAKVGPLLETTGARPAGLYLRARALVALDRYAEALQDIDELRPFDPDPEWLDLTEGWCLKRVGNLDGAVQCMQRLVERSRRSAIGHYNLGCYFALLGEKERAIDEVTVACGIEAKFRTAAADERDLDSLRGDPRFDALLQ